MKDLRIAVAGHVDHGKSTIIGRLLYEAGALSEQTAEKFDRPAGADATANFAFITDQLSDEQEGSFTLDTTQAHFRSAKREYTLIDTPGHREFLKNMITGATRADAAVLVVDAAEGPLRQTYLHAYLIAMLGIRQVIVAINKMDLIGYECSRFRDLSQQMSGYLERLGITPLVVIPVSAQQGDNIVERSDTMPWSLTPTLAEALEKLVCRNDGHRPMRFLVQCPFAKGGRRAILGRVLSGSLRAGQTLTFGPNGHKTGVASVLLGEHEVASAGQGHCVGLFLDDPAPVDRGWVGFDAEYAPVVTDHITPEVFWIGPRPLETNGRIELLCGTQNRTGTVETIARVIDPVRLETIETAAGALDVSQVGQIAIRTDAPMCIDPFDVTPELGRFAIIQDGRIAGGGVIAE